MKRGESFISTNNLNFLPWFLVYNDFLIIIHHDDYQQLGGLLHFISFSKKLLVWKLRKKSKIQYSVMPYLIDYSVSEMCGDIISWKRESLFIYCSIHDVNVAKRVCTRQNNICIHVINYCACLLQEIPNRPILFLIAAYFDQPYRIGYMFSVNKNHENILLFRFIII